MRLQKNFQDLECVRIAKNRGIRTQILKAELNKAKFDKNFVHGVGNFERQICVSRP